MRTAPHRRHLALPLVADPVLDDVGGEDAAAEQEGVVLLQAVERLLERLRRLGQEGSDWSVLTTKGGAFAAQLLAAADLRPRAVLGHEQGSKPEVLQRLVRDAQELWFIEDRRPTLEQVRATPGLEAVRCYLVSWGYLAPGDGDRLPAGIRGLDPEAFQQPLARWP